MRKTFLYCFAALMLVVPANAKKPLHTLDSLRLSDIQLYASSVDPGYVMHGRGLYKADFVINDRGVDFMQVTSRRGGKRGERKHEGIDIAAPYGSEIIYLGFDGESATAYTGFQENGCGNYVFLERDDATTLFCHLSGTSVRDGESVEHGTTIGHVGTSGHSTGPHLHYEKREDNASVRLERAVRLR